MVTLNIDKLDKPTIKAVVKLLEAEKKTYERYKIQKQNEKTNSSEDQALFYAGAELALDESIQLIEAELIQQ